MALTERYVTADSDGGDGTEGNPWTLAEAITNAAAGDRINIKVGSYSQGVATMPNGTAASPIIWRGYSSALGDGYQGRGNSGTGALVTTNFPVVTLTGILTLGTYNWLEALSITGAMNTQLITGAASDVVLRCQLANTNASGSAALTLTAGSTYGSVVDCDLTNATTHASSSVVLLGRWSMAYCRVTGAGAGTGVGDTGYGAGISRCLIANVGIGVALGGACSAYGCSFADIDNGAVRPGGAGAVSVVDCVAYDCKYFIENVTAAKAVLVANCAAGGFKAGGDRWLNQGDQPEFGAITLTADPFVDAASGDYQLNLTDGGGATAKAAGIWPFVDLGALQLASPTLPTEAQVQLDVTFGYGDALTGTYQTPQVVVLLSSPS